MIVNGILMVMGHRTGQAGRLDSRFTLGNRGGFFILPVGYLWSYTGIFGSFKFDLALKVKALPLVINLRIVSFYEPRMEIALP